MPMTTRPNNHQDAMAMSAISTMQGTNSMSAGIQSKPGMMGNIPMSQPGQNVMNQGMQGGPNVSIGGPNTSLGVASSGMGGASSSMGGMNTTMASLGGPNVNTSMIGGPNQTMPSASVQGMDTVNPTNIGGQNPQMGGAQPGMGGQPGIPGPEQQGPNQLQNRNIIWRGKPAFLFDPFFANQIILRLSQIQRICRRQLKSGF